MRTTVSTSSLQPTDGALTWTGITRSLKVKPPTMWVRRWPYLRENLIVHDRVGGQQHQHCLQQLQLFQTILHQLPKHVDDVPRSGLPVGRHTGPVFTHTHARTLYSGLATWLIKYRPNSQMRQVDGWAYRETQTVRQTHWQWLLDQSKQEKDLSVWCAKKIPTRGQRWWPHSATSPFLSWAPLVSWIKDPVPDCKGSWDMAHTNGHDITWQRLTQVCSPWLL